MSDYDFDSFEREDWTSHAWNILEYPEDDLTWDDVRHPENDIGPEDLKSGRRVHTEDERFSSVVEIVKDDDSELDLDDPREFLFEVYSAKEFIEVSPHPENTGVRKLGAYLERMYDEFGVEPVGIKDGSVIDRFEEEFDWGEE